MILTEGVNFNVSRKNDCYTARDWTSIYLIQRKWDSDCEALTRSTTWCSAPCPNTTVPNFAVGTSDSLTRLIPNQTDWTASKAGSFKFAVSAVEWLTPTVIMAGLKNAAVMFHDTRSEKSAMRLRHPTAVQSIRHVDDRRVVVNGIHSSVSCLSFPKPPVKPRDRCRLVQQKSVDQE